ncbi:alpha/beta hydrolase [Mycobacterium kubicae]|uniref:Alpha/beta hydrolase n=1 Tax=Mycobacterium kubicae TaxID=120959 RepID=A0AAX1JAS1_9MYCO|nr:alpha/beta hydrolase [Mycobacterium kubicae]MCV7094457.1 alpha/beta hydrolase [Mycobacterium kubicae]ORW05758.1 lysophospholipase [Mycobacterium kubicae]QNI14059.1 alpha/beta hydrolase [Mycobacterium kubicae]QPI37570.1 alpha/beta hydrolase [Mycobacterium kubicae]GFG66146.1 alpha/beta hydrolase [Mycobacterium kubicae]
MSAKHVVLVHGSWSRGSQWAPARAAFEERGFTVHTPTLRHHQLPLAEGAREIARLSVRDYVADLTGLVSSLDSPALLVGHSLGGLLVQLVAGRTAHAGVIAACPSPVGPSGLNRTTLGIAMVHAAKPRPWMKPVHPPTWQRFRCAVAGAQTEDVARGAFNDLVCESGRALFFELAMPWLDRARAAEVERGRITGPLLVIAGEQDRIVPPRLARRIANRYPNASYAEIPGSDHLVFHGEALPITMGYIDNWVAQQVRLAG